MLFKSICIVQYKYILVEIGLGNESKPFTCKIMCFTWFTRDHLPFIYQCKYNLIHKHHIGFHLLVLFTCKQSLESTRIQCNYKSTVISNLCIYTMPLVDLFLLNSLIYLQCITPISPIRNAHRPVVFGYIKHGFNGIDMS